MPVIEGNSNRRLISVIGCLAFVNRFSNNKYVLLSSSDVVADFVVVIVVIVFIVAVLVFVFVVALPRFVCLSACKKCTINQSHTMTFLSLCVSNGQMKRGILPNL